MHSKNILIVEDEAIIYDSIKSTLLNAGYTVSDFCPSVARALLSITEVLPDLVLLDINLEGKETGIDLGAKLHEKFNIPFMYITGLEEEEIFLKALETNPDLFHIKSKPVLNEKELLRNIKLIFGRTIAKPNIDAQGIFAYPDYAGSMKEKDLDPAFRKLIPFTNITAFIIDLQRNPVTNTTEGKPNYIRINTIEEEEFYLNTSLTKLEKMLPAYFVRISEKAIINISPNILDSKINGSELTTINNNTYTVTKKYKKTVLLKLNEIYITNH